MTMIKHEESHLDHNLTDAHIEFALKQDVTKHGEGPYYAFTVTMPDELPDLPCALYGPLMGDAPVTHEEVYFGRRGDRSADSRLIDKPQRPSRLMTVICGPHDGHDLVLFTAFGGPKAEREVSEDDSPEAARFWSEHALAPATGGK